MKWFKNLILFFALAGSVSAAEPLKVGVLAKNGDEVCRSLWSELADYLTEAIPGETFELVPLAFDNVRSEVELGRVDFLLTNPAIYVGMEHDYGIHRIATMRSLHGTKEVVAFGGVHRRVRL